MKKTISVLLALLLCLSLFACGKSKDTNVGDKKETATEAVTATQEVSETTEAPTAEPTKAPEQIYGKENLALNKPVEVDAVEAPRNADIPEETEDEEPSEEVTTAEENTDEPTVEPSEDEGEEDEDADTDIETFEGENAVDGDYETRWSGLNDSDADKHFIKIDLEKTVKIGYIAITWESCTSSFFIELLDEANQRVAYKYCDAPQKDDFELYTEDYFNGKEARYVVVYITKTAYGSPYEIEVFEQLKENENISDEKQNIATNGTAASDWVEADLTPDKAIDGELTSRWAPGGKLFDVDVTWTLDLGEVKTIDEINVYFESNEAEYRFEIATEDNGTWETVYEWEDTDVAGKQQIKLNGKDARFIRYFRPAGTDGWCSFYEVEVYEAFNA